MSYRKVLLNLVVIAAILAAAAGGCFYLIVNKPEPETRQPPRPSLLVDTMRVKKKAQKMNVIGYGRARSKKELALIAEVSGRVDYISPELREGAIIKKDTLLVRIDQRAYRFAVERAHAQVESVRSQLASLEQEKKNDEINLELAKKELEIAQREYERSESLLKTQSGSVKTLDLAQQALLGVRTRLQTIENRLALWPQRYEMAQAALKESQSLASDADLKLEYTEIFAPFDCRAIERQVEEDQFVGAGSVLARVYDAGVTEISVDVPLRDFVWIDSTPFFAKDAAPTTASVAAPTSATLPRPWAEARLVLDERVWRWRGEVVRADGRINVATQTTGLIVEISDDSRVEFTKSPDEAECDSIQSTLAQLPPGLFVEVEIEGITVENLVEVPRGVLDQKNQVHLIVDGKLVTRQTHVLRALDGSALIDTGLDEGDEVILTPLSAPVDGMSVHTVDSAVESARSETKSGGDAAGKKD